MLNLISLINSKKISIGIAISSLLIIGCQDSYLNQATKLSENSVKLEELFDQQANDYVESCFRRADYTLILPQAENIFEERQKNRDACNEIIVQNKSLFIAQNKIISTYLQAIGNLAKDDNFILLGEDEKTKLTRIINTGSSLIGENISDTSASELGSQSSSVFSQIINFIFEKSAKDFAANEIKTEVEQINEPFQKSICYFKKGWERLYTETLNQEENNLNSYYNNTIIQVVTKGSNEFDDTALNIQRLRQILGYDPSPKQENLPTQYAAYPEIYPYDQEWQSDLNSLDHKRSSLNTYVQILETIANTHAALEKASGGEGKGQETYCPSENSDSNSTSDASSKNSDLDSTANNSQGFIPNRNPETEDINKHKGYKDELIVSFYIDDFEKLVLDLESLHSIYKNDQFKSKKN